MQPSIRTSENGTSASVTSGKPVRAFEELSEVATGNPREEGRVSTDDVISIEDPDPGLFLLCEKWPEIGDETLVARGAACDCESEGDGNDVAEFVAAEIAPVVEAASGGGGGGGGGSLRRSVLGGGPLDFTLERNIQHTHFELQIFLN